MSHFCSRCLRGRGLICLRGLTGASLLASAVGQGTCRGGIGHLGRRGGRLRAANFVLFSLSGLGVVGSQFKRRGNSRTLRLYSRYVGRFFPRGRGLFHVNKSRFTCFCGGGGRGGVRSEVTRLGRALRTATRAFGCPLDVSSKCTYFLPRVSDAFGSLTGQDSLVLCHVGQGQGLTCTNGSRLLATGALVGAKASARRGLRRRVFDRARGCRSLSLGRLYGVVGLLDPDASNFLCVLSFEASFFCVTPRTLSHFYLPKGRFRGVAGRLGRFMCGGSCPLLGTRLSSLLGASQGACGVRCH